MINSSDGKFSLKSEEDLRKLFEKAQQVHNELGEDRKDLIPSSRKLRPVFDEVEE